MSGQSTTGANDSSEGQHNPQNSFDFPRPAPPVFWNPSQRVGCMAWPNPWDGCRTAAYGFREPSAAEPSSSNEASSNEATSTAAPATPERMSAMGHRFGAMELGQNARDPEAAARARAARLERRSFRVTKAEEEKFKASNAAAAARTVTTNAPPKRLSVMHQKLWAMKQKQDAKDPEAAARARAARIQRRKEKEIFDAEIKAEVDRFNASKAADNTDTDADTTNAGASQSSTENRALPAFFYDEREYAKKWLETHPDRCT